jgi:hypothetical protein
MPHPTCHELKSLGRDLRPRGRYTNNRTHVPAFMTYPQRHLVDALHRGWKCRRVDKSRSSELEGLRTQCRVRVDGNDARCAEVSCPDYHPDASASENCDGGIGRTTPVVAGVIIVSHSFFNETWGGQNAPTPGSLATAPHSSDIAPKGHAFSSGALGVIFPAEYCDMTVYCWEKNDTCIETNDDIREKKQRAYIPVEEMRCEKTIEMWTSPCDWKRTVLSSIKTSSPLVERTIRNVAYTDQSVTETSWKKKGQHTSTAEIGLAAYIEFALPGF